MTQDQMLVYAWRWIIARDRAIAHLPPLPPPLAPDE